MIATSDELEGDVGLASGQVHVGRTIGAVMGFATILGTLVIIVTFVITSWGAWRADPWSAVELRIKALTEGYMLQLFWLSIANLGVGITFALSAWIPIHFEDMNNACKTQAYFIAYFPLASSFWSLVLAYEMYRIQFVLRPEKDLYGTFGRTRYMGYHIVCWWFPAISASTIAYYSSPTNAGTWCWMGDPRGRKAAYFAEYLPRASCWATVLFLYISAVIELRASAKRGFPKRVWRAFKKLYLYPLAYLIIMLIPLWQRIFSGYHADGVNGSFTSPALAYIFAFFSATQGVANAVIYILTFRRAQQLLFQCKKTEAAQRQGLLGDSLQQGMEGGMVVSDDVFYQDHDVLHRDHTAPSTMEIPSDPYFALR